MADPEAGGRGAGAPVDSDALRRRILNVVPHALRTPITTLRGLAEAVATATPEEVRDRLGPALRRQAALAERLLDDLLVAAGYTTALPTGGPVEVDAVATIRQAAFAAGLQGDRLTIDAPEDGISVRAPAGTIERCLFHLLDNAAKYTDAPVKVRVGRSGDRVQIDVTSKGPQLMDDPAAMVERFWRSEPAVMASPGLGLGLPVCEALLSHAGGTLTIETPSTGGLVARIELPTS